MAIKLVLEINHPHGRPDVTRPIVVCDECGEEIVRGSDGMYLFDARRENAAYWRAEPVDIYTVHKNWPRGCWGRFVAGMGWEEWAVTDMELSALPAYLANVLSADPEMAEG